jgi:hypothetical protein
VNGFKYFAASPQTATPRARSVLRQVSPAMVTTRLRDRRRGSHATCWFEAPGMTLQAPFAQL